MVVLTAGASGEADAPLERAHPTQSYTAQRHGTRQRCPRSRTATRLRPSCSWACTHRPSYLVACHGHARFLFSVFWLPQSCQEAEFLLGAKISQVHFVLSVSQSVTTTLQQGAHGPHDVLFTPREFLLRPTRIPGKTLQPRGSAACLQGGAPL